MTYNHNAQAQLEYLLLMALVAAAIIFVYERNHRNMGAYIANNVQSIGMSINVPDD